MADSKPPPVEFNNSVKKNDDNDKFDERRLLALVPKGQKKKAKYLLNQFNERGDELTWNSDGVIFVNQISVPGSNIFELLISYQKSKTWDYKILLFGHQKILLNLTSQKIKILNKK